MLPVLLPPGCSLLPADNRSTNANNARSRAGAASTDRQLGTANVRRHDVVRTNVERGKAGARGAPGNVEPGPSPVDSIVIEGFMSSGTRRAWTHQRKECC